MSEIIVKIPLGGIVYTVVHGNFTDSNLFCYCRRWENFYGNWVQHQDIIIGEWFL